MVKECTTTGSGFCAGFSMLNGNEIGKCVAVNVGGGGKRLKGSYKYLLLFFFYEVL